MSVRLVVQVALDASTAERVQEPRLFAPSAKETLPVGRPVAERTTAVRVVAWPKTKLDGVSVRLVVVAAVVVWFDRPAVDSLMAYP